MLRLWIRAYMIQAEEYWRIISENHSELYCRLRSRKDDTKHANMCNLWRKEEEEEESLAFTVIWF